MAPAPAPASLARPATIPPRAWQHLGTTGIARKDAAGRYVLAKTDVVEIPTKPQPIPVPVPAEAPSRYRFAFHDDVAQKHYFSHDNDLAALCARAVATMTPTPDDALALVGLRVPAGVVEFRLPAEVDAALGKGSPAADRVKEMMRATAPAKRKPAKPAPSAFAAVVLASVRRRPGTSAEVVARLSDHPAPSVRGRLSELAASGHLRRNKAGVYRVAS